MPDWSSDGVAYYWGSIELIDADYDSLVILNEIYAKDNATVYFKGKAMSGTDAESFRTVGPGNSSVKNRPNGIR